MKTTLKRVFFTILVLTATNTFAQVGIGTDTPAASAALEITSSTNNKGILIPRITATQKDAISNAVEGLMIYQTSAPTGFYYYTGTTWKLIITQTDLDTKLSNAEATLSFNTKVDKVTGKDLSSNDYTSTEKTKLAAITGTNTGDQDLSALATNTALALKANTSDVNSSLALKANNAEVTNSLATKANTSDVNTNLATKVDKVTGKELSSNDYTTTEKIKLAAITGSNSGDQDLSALATMTSLALKANSTDLNNGLASKVDKVNGKDLSSNDYTAAEKTKVSNLSGTNTGDQTTITGNAATATKLVAPKNINGVAFDGSTDITISATAAAEQLAGTTLKSTVTGSSLTSVGTLADLTVTTPIVGSVTGSSGSSTGNAATATTLATARKINGVDFDGSGDITVNSAAETLSGAILNSTVTSSSLTSVGTITSGTWSATAIAIGNGGTGASNKTVGFDNLSPMTTSGDIIYGETSGTGTRLAKGTDGQILTLASGIPSWTNAFSGVPYSGATGAVDLGNYNLKVYGLTVGLGGSNIGSSTAFGNGTLSANTSGYRNTAQGYQAMQFNETGSENVATGYQAMQNNRLGSSNVAIGSLALRDANGFFNVAIGHSALAFNYEGSYNIGIGRGTLTQNKAGSNNIAIGSEAGYNLNNFTGNGSGNTLIGHQAARGKNLGSENTALGFRALYTAPISNYSSTVAIGTYAGYNNEASNNTFLGTSADLYTTDPNYTGFNNSTAIGFNAKVGASNTIQLGNTSVTNVKTSGTITAGTITYPNTTGTANQVLTTNGSGVATWATAASGVPYLGATGVVNLGAYDLTVNGLTIGKGLGNISDNTAVGNNALSSVSSSGGANSAFGFQALQANTTGGNGNSAFGYQALKANTTGYQNTAIGTSSLSNNSLGYYNIGLGSGALNFNTEGNFNIGIGRGTLTQNKYGGTNIAIGSEAGYHLNSYNYSSGTGGGNVFIGYQSGLGRNRGSNNTAIGQQSLYSFTTDFYNYSNAVAIGIQSGFNNITNDNTFLGSFADVDYSINSSIINATAVGYQSKVLASNTIQLGNTSVTNVKTSGTITAGTITYPNTTGTANQVLTTDGSGVATWATAASGVPYLGATGVVNLGAYDLTVNDLTVGKGASSVSTNSAFGKLALSSATTGGDNVSIGYQSLKNLSSGYSNIAIGSNTLLGLGATQLRSTLNTASYNIAIGNNSQTSSSKAYDNISIGHEAMRYSGGWLIHNIAIGTEALRGVQGYHSDWVWGSGNNNIAIGYQSGLSTGTGGGGGAYNVYYGVKTGQAIVGGNGNTMIGNEANASSDFSNSTAIGNAAIVGASNTIQLGNTSVTDVKTSGTITAGTITYPNAHGTAGQVLTTAGSGALSWATPSTTATAYSGTLAITNGGTGSASKNFVDLTTDQTVEGAKTFNNDIGVNGITIGRGSGSKDANITIGFASLFRNTTGLYNNAFGYNALYSNTSGTTNNAIGYKALQYNDLGSWNNALGANALNRNTSGQYNSAVGTSTMEKNTTGSINNAFGYGALYWNTTSDGNSAFGHSALYATTGAGNAAFGARAMQGNTSGNSNTSVGSYSLANSTSGSDNTAVGANTLAINTTGGQITAIGSGANVGSNNLTNATALGYGATVAASNTIQLGNGSITNVYTNGTINANGTVLTSDRRLKTNIEPIQNSIETIMKLNPVHYDKKNSLESKEYDKKENGFIAQELQKIIPYIVKEGTDKNKLLSLDYNSIIPLLTKGIQTQQSMIEAQQKQIETSNEKIEAQQNQLNEIKELLLKLTFDKTQKN